MRCPSSRLFVLAFYLFCTIQQISADQFFPSHTVGTLGRSSRDPKFRIDFHPEESPFHPDDDQESVFMTNKNGKNYLCYLPKVDRPKSWKPTAQQNTSNVVMETEKRVRVKSPDELLEILKDQCFLRQEGWWSYEFCFHKRLRQIHLEDDTVVQEFILGVYDQETTEAYHQNHSDISTLKDPRSKDASLRYHAHQFTNGTMCDLTNRPRETEVRFVCSEPRAMISSITELSTCKYALTVHAPMLCKHPLFQEERPVWHTINCNAIPKDEQETKPEETQELKRIKLVTDLGFLTRNEAEE